MSFITFLIIDDDMKLCRQVDIQQLLLANNEHTLESLAMPVVTYANTLDLREELVKKLEKSKVNIVPVIDANQHLVGIIQTSLFLMTSKKALFLICKL